MFSEDNLEMPNPERVTRREFLQSAGVMTLRLTGIGVGTSQLKLKGCIIKI